MPSGSPSTSATQQPCLSWSTSASVRSTEGSSRGTPARNRIHRECGVRPSNTACSGPVSPGASGRTTTRGSESPRRSSICSAGAPCADVRVIIVDPPARRVGESRAAAQGGRAGFSGPSARLRDHGRRRKAGGRHARDPAGMTSTSLRPPATPAADRRAGARAAIPFVIGLAPFAVTVGAAVGTSEDPLAAWTGTLLLYGGSAQLAGLQGLGTGAPGGAAIPVGGLVNARPPVFSGGGGPP